ncbi:hypothetical protein VNO77_21969 [Canavalia gladiata]|uniref:Uncharacterized protein n=1 Tax=Canavalia gladiata TaxID=3824 RepID=A0AAN9QA28_CANGL
MLKMSVVLFSHSATARAQNSFSTEVISDSPVSALGESCHVDRVPPDPYLPSITHTYVTLSQLTVFESFALKTNLVIIFEFSSADGVIFLVFSFPKA